MRRFPPFVLAIILLSVGGIACLLAHLLCRTAIFYAAAAGNVAGVRIALTTGVDPNIRGGVGCSPLHWAAGDGHLDVIEVLLAHGADVDVKDTAPDWGWTPLHCSAEGGQLDATRLLIKHGAKTLVADGESRPDIPSLLELASDGLIDVLIMDIVGLGFTAWRQWMPRVVDAQAWAAPHTWGDRLKTHYAAELAAGLGNVLTVEGVPAETTDVDWHGYRLEAGSLRVPDEAGFGMRLIAAE